MSLTNTTLSCVIACCIPQSCILSSWHHAWNKLLPYRFDWYTPCGCNMSSPSRHHVWIVKLYDPQYCSLTVILSMNPVGPVVVKYPIGEIGYIRYYLAQMKWLIRSCAIFSCYLDLKSLLHRFDNILTTKVVRSPVSLSIHSLNMMFVIAFSIP